MNKSTTIISKKQVAPTLKKMNVGESESFPRNRSSVVRATIGRLQIDMDRSWTASVNESNIVVTRIA